MGAPLGDGSRREGRARQSTQDTIASGDAVLAAKRRLQKLVASPYFGRFDFRARADEAERAAYVGVHSLAELGGGAPLIYDWRAPIASLFYDYELGEARYASPQGDVAGEILLKRQFRIRGGRMEFKLEAGCALVRCSYRRS